MAFAISFPRGRLAVELAARLHSVNCSKKEHVMTDFTGIDTIHDDELRDEALDERDGAELCRV
jgi:hypothetical protein